MLKILFFSSVSFLFVLVSACFAEESIPITAENVYDRSELWPFNVLIIHQENCKRLGGGFPGILLRIEKDGRALIDYGRDGRHRIPVADTDIVENANKILEGQLVKEFPNFLRQTTNMFATRLVGQKHMKPIDLETLVKYKRILLVYCDESVFTEKSWISFKSFLNDFKFTIPLIIPTQFSFYKGLAEHSEWDGIHVILPYLSIPNREVFEHNPVMESGGLTFVLINLEGKVHQQWRSHKTETHSQIFDEVTSYLNQFEDCINR